MHAASLNATEGAPATATAITRASRAEAMKKEAEATAKKTENTRKTAAPNAEMAVETDPAHEETANTISTTAAEPEQRQKMWEDMVREQQRRRAKMLVRKIAAATFCSSDRNPIQSGNL